MKQTTRRRFLKRSVVGSLALALPRLGTVSTRVQAAGPNDEIRVAVVGLGGIDDRRGRGRAGTPAHRPPARGSRRPDRRPVRRGPGDPGPRTSAVQGSARDGRRLRRPPQAARRQDHRRRGHRHAQPLARAGDDLGLPGGQGRLRREAVLVQHLGRPADGRRRPQIRPHGPGRHPEPFQRGPAPGLRVSPQRRSSGRSAVPTPSSTGRARASARSARRRRCRRRSTTTSGAARPPRRR